MLRLECAMDELAVPRSSSTPRTAAEVLSGSRPERKPSLHQQAAPRMLRLRGAEPSAGARATLRRCRMRDGKRAGRLGGIATGVWRRSRCRVAVRIVLTSESAMPRCLAPHPDIGTGTYIIVAQVAARRAPVCRSGEHQRPARRFHPAAGAGRRRLLDGRLERTWQPLQPPEEIAWSSRALPKRSPLHRSPMSIWLMLVRVDGAIDRGTGRTGRAVSITDAMPPLAGLNGIQKEKLNRVR